MTSVVGKFVRRGGSYGISADRQEIAIPPPGAPRPAGFLGNHRGQSTVEIALVSVPLASFLMGVLLVGFMWMHSLMITHAARETARTAAVAPQSVRCSSGEPACANGHLTDAYTQALERRCREVWLLWQDQDENGVDLEGCSGIKRCTLTFDDGSTKMVRAVVESCAQDLPVFGAFAPTRTVSFLDEGR